MTAHAEGPIGTAALASASPVSVEITERATIDDVKDIQARVDALRQLGFRIAIDDLGSWIRGPLKLRRAAAGNRQTRHVARAQRPPIRRPSAVAAMTSVAKEMGMRVIAEGIELLEERDVVHGYGCHRMQGYFFAEPGHPFPFVDRMTMKAMRPADAVTPPGGVSVGSTIDGRYELRRDLGRGAAGVVFEARHCFTERDVALKVTAPDVQHAQLGELRARLTREPSALAAVPHPPSRIPTMP